MDKAERSAGFELRARYVSDLEGAFRRDMRRLERYQQVLNRRPLEIPVRFDFAGLQREANKARDIVQNAMRMPTILGPSGSPARGFEAELNRTAGRIATTTRKTYDKLGKKITSIVEEATDQEGPGFRRTTRTKIDPITGARTARAEIVKDTRTVEALNAELQRAAQLNRDFNKARGRGDVGGQRKALEAQIKAIGGQDGILARAASGGLGGTPEFKKAESRLDRLRDKVETLDGREEAGKAKQQRRDRTRTVDRFITGEERRVQTALKANKLEADQAERIPDRAARETELNRIYDERRKIFERSQAMFGRLDQRLQEQSRPDLSDRAFRRTLGMANQVNQVDLDKSRFQTDSMRAAEKERAREDARLRREAERQARQDREAKAADLEKRMLDSRKSVARSLTEVSAEERGLLAKTTKKNDRRLIGEKMAERRQSILQGGASAMLGFEGEADKLGKTKLSLSARGTREDFRRKEIEMLNRQAEAAMRGGKAFDFHTSSLIRNAASFARWSAAAGSVMAITRAISSGFSEMVKVDRQFATLKAVFRGTDQEAQRLKDSTLALAVANGRSSDEAMDSAIRFSRLGLTRVQVLKATETALKAANVAEVDAAYAAEKLSSIMATYKVTVEDLPDVLNKANAISNRFNVTNKDLFEVMSRASGIGKQLGLEMTDLMAAGAAVTGATGRTGGETGNAIRYIMQQISNPEKIEKLKSLFNFDVTDGVGNLKDMQTVLTEMSELYPKLTNHQQAMFTDLVAGSRQADRFTKLMEGMATQQYLAGKAFADTDSAWRENENIMDSLASKVEALKSAWTELWVTMGDSGAIDAASDVMTALKLMVQSAVGSSDHSSKRRFTDINDRFLLTRAGNTGTMGFPDRQFSDGQIRGAEDNMKQIARLKQIGRENKDKDFFDINMLPEVQAIQKDLITRAGADPDVARKNLVRGKEGKKGFTYANNRDEDFFEPEDFLKDVQKIMAEDKKAKSINATTQARNNIGFLTRGEQGFAGLARRVAGGPGTFDLDATLKDFDQFSELLLDLQGGPQEYAKRYSRVRDNLRSGNASGDLEDLSKLFGNQLPGAKAAFLSTQDDQVGKLEEELASLDRDRQKAMDAMVKKRAEGKDVTEDEIKAQEELKTKIKETGDALQQIKKGLEETRQSGLSMQAGINLAKSLDRSLRQSSNMVESIKGAMGGFSDQPGSRSFTLDAMAITAPEDALARRAQEAEAATRKLPSAENREILDRTRFRLSELRDTNKEKRESLTDEAPGREFADAIRMGSRRSTIASQAAAFGRNQSEQSLNQSRFLLTEIGTTGRRLAGSSNNPRDTNFMSASEKGANIGSMLGKEQAVRENLLSLETRQFQITADRKNLEIELAEAQKEQTREASKRLMMATREDQLRAAALSRTIRSSGKLSNDEFMFLGDASRQAVQNFMPGQGPDMLDDAKENYSKARQKLDEEQQAIAASLAGLRKTFDQNEEAMSRLMGKGGFLPTGGERVPEYKLNVQPVVTVKLAEEFRGITEDAVRLAVMPEIESIRRWMKSTSKYLTSGTNSASGN